MAYRFADDDPCTYAGGHSDPDNTGLCIHCGAVMYPSPEDLADAIEGGRDPATFPQARAYVENTRPQREEQEKRRAQVERDAKARLDAAVSGT